jgi:hypothetical protein
LKAIRHEASGVLKILQRYWPYLALFFIALVSSYLIFSPSFQECKNYDAKTNQYAAEICFQETSSKIVAIYTKVLAAFTAMLAVVACIQIHFLKRSDDLAAAAARTAELSLISGRRAFVYGTGFQQFFEKDPQSGLYSWRFRVAFKNTGETQTKGMKIFTQCEIRNTPYPAGHIFTDDPSRVIGGFIPPKADMGGGQIPLGPTPAVTPQDILDAQASAKFIYVWGWVRYFDTFPNTKEHITHFCWQVVPSGDPKTFVPHTTGQPPTPGTLIFGFTYHPEGNWTDDENQ